MTVPASDPAIQAGLWQFIADVRNGVAEPGPDDFTFACQLVGAWEAIWSLYYMRVKDVPRSAAEAAAAELVDSQRLLYASLAASPDSEQHD